MDCAKLRMALKLRPVSHFVRTNEIAPLYLSLVNNTHKQAGVKTGPREWRNFHKKRLYRKEKKMILASSKRTY